MRVGVLRGAGVLTLLTLGTGDGGAQAAQRVTFVQATPAHDSVYASDARRALVAAVAAAGKDAPDVRLFGGTLGLGVARPLDHISPNQGWRFVFGAGQPV